MNHLPLDPDECPGTPEHEELHQRRKYMRQIYLDLLQEQYDADHLQYHLYQQLLNKHYRTVQIIVTAAIEGRQNM